MIPQDPRHRLTHIVANAETISDVISAVRQERNTNMDEHWLTLLKYAKGQVLELGTGYSTIAWLAAGCQVISVDTEVLPWVCRLVELANGRLRFILCNDLDLAPRRADVLFIDTFHVYAHLLAELNLHGPYADTIILHDTVAFRDADAPYTKHFHPGDRGLWAAVEEFCQEHPYYIREHFTNQLGLTVLQRTPKEEYRVLVVCSGNACRSPMAEYLLKRALKERFVSHVIIEGTGTCVTDKDDMRAYSGEAADALARAGVDMSKHVRQPITQELVDRADLILVAEAEHRDFISKRWSHVTDNIKMMRPSGEGVIDPIGGGDEAHDACVELLDGAMRYWADQIVASSDIR